jgi:NAD(P)-dependent dehydrogenase (short-subunit alcohol dehydrogenase family)
MKKFKELADQVRHCATTSQESLLSGFDATTTALQALGEQDLTGKIAVVTGGYSGIGLETVRVLQSSGAKVIVPARDCGRAAAALKGMDVEIEEMDLLDPNSIDAFANRFRLSGRPLHLLVNSAGIMANSFTLDFRGYETQFATNHLGHFQLTLRLWDALCRANGARVVSVSSWGHRFSPVVLEDLNFQRREYDRWLAYGQSKTANILFAVALDERAKGKGVRAFSLHPGAIVDTGLGKHIPREDLRKAGVIDDEGKPVLDPAKGLKSVEQGAATIVWCATSPQLDGKGGVYCQDCDIAPLVPQEVQANHKIGSLPLGVMSYAVDPRVADRLWRLSDELVFGNR